MVKILFSHKNMSQDDLKLRGDLHVFKMDGVTIYIQFQPLINEFKPLLSIYSDSLLLAKLGGEDRIKAENKAKKDVDAYITKIAKAVEEEANNNRPESEGIEFAEGAGFVNGSHPLCSLDGSSTRFYSKSVFHSAKSIGAFRNYISAIPPSE